LIELANFLADPVVSDCVIKISKFRLTINIKYQANGKLAAQETRQSQQNPNLSWHHKKQVSS
jgi:hypothetical protein